MVYVSGVLGSLLDKYALYYKGLHARIAWKQLGHSTQTLRGWMELGSVFSRPDFVLTVLLTHDILRMIIRPFARKVQAHLEPCSIMVAQDVLMGQLSADRLAIQRLPSALAVAALCRLQASPNDLARFIRAFAVGSLGKFFPTFFEHFADTYGSSRSQSSTATT